MANVQSDYFNEIEFYIISLKYVQYFGYFCNSWVNNSVCRI